jgi:hypothetical protein
VKRAFKGGEEGLKMGSNLPFAAKGRFDPIFLNEYDEAKREREAP